MKTRYMDMQAEDTINIWICGSMFGYLLCLLRDTPAAQQGLQFAVVGSTRYRGHAVVRPKRGHQAMVGQRPWLREVATDRMRCPQTVSVTGTVMNRVAKHAKICVLNISYTSFTKACLSIKSQ